MAYSPLIGGIYEKPEEPLPVQYRSEYNELVRNVIADYVLKYDITASQLVLSAITFGTNPIIPIVTASREEHLEKNLVQASRDTVNRFIREIEKIHTFAAKYS